MKKNKIYSYAALAAMFTTSLVSCQPEDSLYEGDNFIMFAKDLNHLPATPDTEKSYPVRISATKAVSYDRSYAVEIDPRKSTAISGLHFDLVSNNVVIKAGELAAEVLVKPNFNKVSSTENLSFHLRLLSTENESSSMYGDTTNVELIKCPDFDINKFASNLRLSCNFPFQEYTTYYVKSEVKNDSTLIIKEPFNANYDIQIRFKKNNINPFEQGVVVSSQPAFADMGYGLVHTNTVANLPSFYVTEVGGIALNLDMFVPKVGSFGVHQYLFQWVPQELVDAESNGTGSPLMMTSNAWSMEKSINE